MFSRRSKNTQTMPYEDQRWKIIGSGAVHQVVKLMQTCNWKSLAEKMEEYEGNSQE